ncbi:protein SLOW GREEN 1, chloroplastic [Quercus suber]|uniref:Protein slow green 1 n=1 Tax=Quercus suber TaxID=58331 RepID=A0AAW0IJA6_QUESU|nr:protein SLOW GREEN 1, chloroplastic-like [Quercus suber]XP_023921541.1 protein SLOW GREEN 1, chloroplastic-like [Quercus suber]
MESLSKLNYRHQPFHLSVNHHRPSFQRPISSLSFRTPPSSSSAQSSPFKSFSIKASSSSSAFPQNPKPQLSKTLTPLLKTTCITVAAAAALFFIRFQHKPAFAATATAPPPTVEESINTEETESSIEDRLSQDPEDVEALKSLMEVRIKAQKLKEAIQVIDRLIELEPEEFEWPLLKANIFSYMGEQELAKSKFEEILEKDPLRVEAYHGLVMVSSELSDENMLKELAKRVEEATEKCDKLGKKSDARDFKLLVAQINVVKGLYNEALRIYEQLAKEEPRDFRPYLCQGILYTLLSKKDEAEKQFDKFRRLVPKNHPYKEYFDDNMFATKLFAQKVERERKSSRR